jgi:hypothetical protein
MMSPMRTTLTLADELAARAKRDAERLGLSFKEIINRALEIGLQKLESNTSARKYRTKPTPMGLRKGLSYDDIAELLARAEQEDFR